MKNLIFLLAVGAALGAAAQTNASKTWFNAYKSAVDAPLFRGMSTVGTLSGQIAYPVQIRVERLIIQPTTNTIYGVAVRTTLARGVTQVDYIDYDELDGLIRGLQLIAQADHSVVPMDDFEVVYRVRSGLSVAKISDGNKLTIAIRSGDTNATINRMAPYVLDSLTGLLTSAKAKIDAISASGQ